MFLPPLLPLFCCRNSFLWHPCLILAMYCLFVNPVSLVTCSRHNQILQYLGNSIHHIGKNRHWYLQWVFAAPLNSSPKILFLCAITIEKLCKNAVTHSSITAFSYEVNLIGFHRFSRTINTQLTLKYHSITTLSPGPTSYDVTSFSYRVPCEGKCSPIICP